MIYSANREALSQSTDLLGGQSTDLLGGLNDFLRFRQKVRIHFQRKNFTVKTVETRRELVQAFHLRYEVFHKEFAGRKFPIGLDTDRYDPLADLLVIVDTRTKRVVGTYRLICSKFGGPFYSESEFDLSSFLSGPGIKLELSRACIHRDYRQGIVMGLLWRGLGEYMTAVGAQYLFGCSSVKHTDPKAIAGVYRRLKAMGKVNEATAVEPVSEYRIEGFKAIAEGLTEAEAEGEIPALFQAYLRAGASVYGEPALDLKFRCADFLTVLDRDQMSAGHEKKFVAQ
jgi:putative hemolysin